jgi:hypothetical protein
MSGRQRSDRKLAHNALTIASGTPYQGMSDISQNRAGKTRRNDCLSKILQSPGFVVTIAAIVPGKGLGLILASR